MNMIKQMILIVLLTGLSAIAIAADKEKCEVPDSMKKLGQYLSETNRKSKDVMEEMEANVKTAKGGASSWIEVVPDGGGATTGKIGDYTTTQAGEVFYRTISQEDYNKLMQTGRMPATTETSTSPTQAFSESYQGVLVKYYVQHGTIDKLTEFGTTDGHEVVREQFGELVKLPAGTGWIDDYARFKYEKGQVNIQLGRGPGIDIFNANLIAFERVR
jgi:hypothetical protein